MGISLEKLLRQLGINPGELDVDVPLGHAPFYGRPGEDTEGSQSFTVPSGTTLDTRLSFTPGSAIIDNNTSNWLRMLDATKDGTGRFVPPGYPASMALLGSVSRGRLDWTAPANQLQPAFIAGEQAVVVFFASKIAPGLGIASPQTSSGRTVAFASASRAIGTYTFVPPKMSAVRGLICYLAVTAGAGTVTIAIATSDTSLVGGVTSTWVTSVAIASGTGVNILVYPGITAATNASASAVVGATPSIVATVAGAAATFQVDYDTVL